MGCAQAALFESVRGSGWSDRGGEEVRAEGLGVDPKVVRDSLEREAGAVSGLVRVEPGESLLPVAAGGATGGTGLQERERIPEQRPEQALGRGERAGGEELRREDQRVRDVLPQGVRAHEDPWG